MKTRGTGDRVAGRYVLETEIGRGGMGAVWRAHDLTLKRHVAIKTIVPHLELDESARRRFEREAQAVAQLKSPHIVQILGLVLVGTGVVAVGVGGGFAVDAASKNDDADAFCDETGCLQEGLDKVGSAQTSGDIATVLMIGGGGVATGGLLVFLLAPSSGAHDASGSLGVRATGGPSGASLNVTATF